MRKVLAFMLFLSGVMPLALGALSLASYPEAMEMLGVADTTETHTLITIIGAGMIPLGILQWIAAWWVWKNRQSGITLATWFGLLFLLEGALLYFLLHRADLAVPDLIKGALITLLTFFVRPQTQRGKLY